MSGNVIISSSELAAIRGRAEANREAGGRGQWFQELSADVLRLVDAYQALTDRWHPAAVHLEPVRPKRCADCRFFAVEQFVWNGSELLTMSTKVGQCMRDPKPEYRHFNSSAPACRYGELAPEEAPNG